MDSICWSQFWTHNQEIKSLENQQWFPLEGLVLAIVDFKLKLIWPMRLERLHNDLERSLEFGNTVFRAGLGKSWFDVCVLSLLLWWSLRFLRSMRLQTKQRVCGWHCCCKRWQRSSLCAVAWLPHATAKLWLSIQRYLSNEKSWREMNVSPQLTSERLPLTWLTSTMFIGVSTAQTRSKMLDAEVY